MSSQTATDNPYPFIGSAKVDTSSRMPPLLEGQLDFHTYLFGAVVKFENYESGEKKYLIRLIYFYIEDDGLYHYAFCISDHWLPDLIAIATRAMLVKPKKGKKSK